MKIHFLGTAAAEGFPNPFCNCNACNKARKLDGKNIRMRTSVIIDDILKVDHPPDSNAQALRDGIDLSIVRDLLITHTHYDHLNAGELISRLKGYASGVSQPLNIYGNDKAIHQCRYALLEENRGEEQFLFHVVQPFKQYKLEGAVVTPLLADHDPKETCLLYHIEKENSRILYGNDSGWFPDETWEWLKNKELDLAILDCTVGSTSNKFSRNHMSVETVIEAQKELQKIKALKNNGKIIATHFSHNSGLLHEDLIEMFQPHQINVAYDGLVIRV